MLSLLTTLGGNALRTLIPAAVNWGMNKLSTSNFGKTVVAPTLATSFSPWNNAIPQNAESPEKA
jgi:hypothetical protein